MKNAGEFIGKTVLSLSGERLGEINNLTFDRYFKRLKNISVFNDEQEEFLLPVSSIYCHGDNVVLTRINLRPPAPNTFLSPLTVKAYDICGKLLGMISDMGFEEDGKTTKSFILEGGESLLPFNVSSHGKDAVLFDFSNKPKRFLKSPKHITELDTKAPALIAEIKPPNSPQEPPIKNDEQDVVGESLQAAENAESKESADLPKLPENFVVGAKLLIGRRVKGNIYTKGGKILIKQGALITIDTVNLALKHGKLFELTVNSLGRS